MCSASCPRYPLAGFKERLHSGWEGIKGEKKERKEKEGRETEKTPPEINSDYTALPAPDFAWGSWFLPGPNNYLGGGRTKIKC